MLEIRNITKVYRSKTGQEVKALDDVSISFPESGMVFILGKSGSGKSTLLNVIGGLDSYDSGEFSIMGKSSKDFVGSDFDAYRNTFIGFIFQEYNILDEFSVGANIGLALELQGQKASSERINEILAEVDLLDYAGRKPNELSGGQKQRVAIARALVKKPQIIMADEPTGALDSNTGKQIFDTLKKLSKEKLVLIVSHDRDFAERYADRIVELADGKIISDVSKHEKESVQLSDGMHRITDNILRIEGGYQLTQRDVALINEYLAKSKNSLILSADNRVNNEMRSAAGITEQGTAAVFEETNPEADCKLKAYEGGKTKFIRSRLPMKNAVRIGASGLKHKKFRLVMTILLSFISFAMFGLADTLAAYDKITAATNSIHRSVELAEITNASFVLRQQYTYRYGDGDSNTSYQYATMNDKDIAALSEKTGLDFVPVFNGSGNDMQWFEGISIQSAMAGSDKLSEAYTGKIFGFVNMAEEDIEKAQLTLTGSMPTRDGEIVITELMFRQLKENGFVNNQNSAENVEAGQLTMDDNPETGIIGRHIHFNLQFGVDSRPDGTAGTTYKIVGVVDTHFEYDRYADFLPKEGEKNQVQQGQDQKLDVAQMVLALELADTLKYGFHSLCFITESDIENMAKNCWTYSNVGQHLYELRASFMVGSEEKGFYEQYIDRVAGNDALETFEIAWLDGDLNKTELAADEIVVSYRILQNLMNYWGESNFNPNEIITISLNTFLPDDQTKPDETMELKIVGVFNSNEESLVICNTLHDYVTDYMLQDENRGVTEYYPHMAGKWAFAVAPMPTDKASIEKLVKLSYEETGLQFRMQNQVMNTLYDFDEFIEIGSLVFLGVGIGFAVFSAILLMNFISTSISYKKREIGILRAVGARSSDVFKIFFSESFIIALINYILAVAATVTTVFFINKWLFSQGIKIQLLNFGVRQLALMFGVCFAVAVLASFLPVHRIAKRKPIDAIKDR